MNPNIQIKDKVIFPKLSYEICGVLFKVHNNLGRYSQEKHYSILLEKFLKERGIKFEREKIINFNQEEKNIFKNRIDFLIDDKIIIELKAKRFIAREDYLQTKRYLEILKLPLALIVNFHQRYLKPKRILNSKYYL